jgi:hypothetical protein
MFKIFWGHKWVSNFDQWIVCNIDDNEPLYLDIHLLYELYTYSEHKIACGEIDCSPRSNVFI